MKQFYINPVYIPLLDCEKKYVVLKGGAGSGKTTFAVQKVLIRVMTQEKHRFLIIKKVKNQIKDFIWKDFVDIIREFELTPYFNINNSSFTLTYLPNGNEIVFKGLESEEDVRGIKGITSVLIDEASDLLEDDFLQLVGRVREPSENYKQFILCFNPVSEDHWLKSTFFDNEDDEVVAMSTTFEDNLALSDEWKNDMRKRYASNERMYRIYVMGEWGTVSTKGAMYDKFEVTRHVNSTQYNSKQTLHISIDFNTLPYCSISVWQIHKFERGDENVTELHCIDEITGKGTKEACENFLKKYQDHDAPVYYTGDPSGRKDDTRNEAGYNDFTLLNMTLSNDFSLVSKIPSKAPAIHKRAEWINLIFEEEYDSIKIVIDPRCKLFINDLIYAKVDENGDKFVQKSKDKETGRPFEKYHHWVDGMSYFICSSMNAKWNNFQKGRGKGYKFPTYYTGQEFSSRNRF